MTRMWLLCGSLALATIGLATANPTNAEAAVARPGTTACSGTIAINQLHFVPPSVARGGKSTAHLAARNCTNQNQSTELTWLGQFLGKHSSGCPAIDPLPEPAAFKRHGTFTATLTYDIPSSCTASRLQVTVRFTGSGGTLIAKRSADLSITP